jgi:hypothetical protein
MLEEFFKSFLEAVTGTYSGPVVVYRPPLMQRPSRKKMKRHLSDALKEKRTQYRCKIVIRGREYHAIYAYVHSAIYTLTYEITGKKLKFPKLVSYHNGKPTIKYLKEEIQFEVREKQKRIDRAFTMGR